MGKTNKGLHTKVINVFDPESDEEFEIYVTFEKYHNTDYDDDIFDVSDTNREDVDIKYYESNDDNDIPFWVTEDLIYDYLIDELLTESDEDVIFDDDDEDEFENEIDENW